jgi:hypothetical protein
MKQTGFILLTTMLLILTSALLVLSLMQGVFLYSKECHQIIASHQAFHTLENIAMTLDLNQIACHAQETNPNQLLANVAAGKGCLWTDDQQKYRYSIADLGFFPCLPITADTIQYSSHHWLVTVTHIPSHNQTIQMRLATLSDVTALCDLSVEHPIAEGVISWRFLGA